MKIFVSTFFLMKFTLEKQKKFNPTVNVLKQIFI